MAEDLHSLAKELLISLIETPSLSREEHTTASLLEEFFAQRNIPTQRIENNVIVRSKYFSDNKPTVLLNSHHDTVRPVTAWVTDPFSAVLEDGKIIGLGSNDAGAPLVALLCAFLHYYHNAELQFNLLFVASAEEEVSGKNGVELILPELGEIAVGIVGEPTSMDMAIAEKGLLVLDCVAKGVAGHAGHNTGDNAIYKAIKDIEWFQTYKFPKESEVLGPVKMTVTGIQSGKQHNIVPDECTFMVDVRTNECYSNKEVFELIQSSVESEVTPRSFRLNSSMIPQNHPLVIKGKELGRRIYGSPTLSDQAFMMGFPTVKIGPGDTHRSHTAQEYVLESELYHGIDTYIKLLEGLVL